MRIIHLINCAILLFVATIYPAQVIFKEDFGQPIGRKTTPYAAVGYNAFIYASPQYIYPLPKPSTYTKSDAEWQKQSIEIENNHYAVVSPKNIYTSALPNTSSWKVWEALETYAKDASGDGNGGVMIVNAGLTPGVMYYRPMQLQRGKYYKLSYDVFVQYGDVKLRVNFLNSDGTKGLGTNVSDLFRENRSFQNKVLYFYLPTVDCDDINYTISIQNENLNNQGNDFAIDNIMLEEVQSDATIEAAAATVLAPCATNIPVVKSDLSGSAQATNGNSTTCFSFGTTSNIFNIYQNDVNSSGGAISNVKFNFIVPQGGFVNEWSDGKKITVPGEGVWAFVDSFWISGVEYKNFIQFTPDSSFKGSPTEIKYSISEVLTVNGKSVTVTSNEADVKVYYCGTPLAENDLVKAKKGDVVSINILNNDKTNLSEPGSTSNLVVTSIWNPSTGIWITDLLSPIIVPGEGAWLYNTTTGILLFTPQPGFEDNPTNIKYKITDKIAVGSATADVSIVVEDDPVSVVIVEAIDNSNSVVSGGSVQGNILDNDTSSDQSILTVASATYFNNVGAKLNLTLGTSTIIYTQTGVKAGSIILNSDGSYSFTSEKGFVGVVPLDYVAVNPTGENAAARLLITVVEGNETISNCDPFTKESNPSTAFVSATYEYFDQAQSTVEGIQYGDAGSGIVKAKKLLSFQTNSGTRKIQRIGIPDAKFYVRRNTDPTQFENDILYIENIGSSNTRLVLEYPKSMESFFSEGYVNAGLDNIFANVAANTSNAERVDVIFENGYKVIDPSNEMILITERGRNNNIHIGVVKRIDNANMPLEIGVVKTVLQGEMFSLLKSGVTGANPNMNYTIIKKTPTDTDYKFATAGGQEIGLAAITYKDLGVNPGETIYGYVLLPTDYSKNGATALEFEKFPINTYEDNGGHDIGIVYGVFSACDSYVCYNSGNYSNPGIPVNHGVTLLKRAGADKDNWPMVRNSGFTVIESNNKGFVPTRMSKIDIEGDASNPSEITNPEEGMMIYDTTDQCLKIYDGTQWGCFSTPSCP